MRRLNSALVLRAIRDGGSMSRSEISRLTGLSKPTVHEVVESLLRTGYVRESSAGERGGRPGPRARLLTFRADLGYVLGIDIGANKLLALVADLGGTIVASERRRTSGGLSSEALLDEVCATARAALSAAKVERTSLKAVGVGTPGVVDPVSGEVTLAPQLAGWEGLQLGKKLERSFPCPVLVDNEVHLALLAERWRGAVQGIDEVFYVQLGVGIGGGILVGGDLYRGSAGAAAEIGYLPVSDDRHEPSGAGPGPFELAAGGTAFARLGQASAAGPGGKLLRELAGGDPASVDAEIVFAAARQGDKAALTIVDELTKRLARGIASVVVVLNPATVVIGGGLSRAGAVLMGPLERRVSELVPWSPLLVLSALGDEAVALGAVRLGIQSVEERLFSFDEVAV